MIGVGQSHSDINPIYFAGMKLEICVISIQMPSRTHTMLHIAKDSDK